MDFLQAVTDHTLIVALAIAGAVIATAGSLLGQGSAVSAKLARLMVRGGYAVTFASVGLFIIAGFLKGR